MIEKINRLSKLFKRNCKIRPRHLVDALGELCPKKNNSLKVINPITKQLIYIIKKYNYNYNIYIIRNNNNINGVTREQVMRIVNSDDIKYDYLLKD